MSYLLLIMVSLIIYTLYISKENKRLHKRASAELRYEIAARQLDQWNTKYGRGNND
jgi:hypothetical protein